MKNKLDPFTFGNSKACVNLAKILSDEHPESSHKISTCLGSVGNVINQIINISSPKFRYSTAKLWKEKFLENIDKMNISHVVRTHTKNIVHSKFNPILNSSQKKIRTH